MKILLLNILLLLLFSISSAYIHELTPSNFDTLVNKGNDVWVVEFYSPSCPYCKAFAPEMDQLSSSLEGSNIKVGRVDGVQYDDLSGKYNIRGFPTVKLFRPGSGVAEEYKGARKSQNIVEFVRNFAQDKKVRADVTGEQEVKEPQTLRVSKT